MKDDYKAKVQSILQLNTPTSSVSASPSQYKTTVLNLINNPQPTKTQPQAQPIQVQQPKKQVQLQDSGINLKKLGDAFVAGSKSLPGMAMQAGGILFQNVIQTKRAIDNFFKPLQAVDKLFMNPVQQKGVEFQNEIKNKGMDILEQKALALREKGQQSQSNAQKEYAKNYIQSGNKAQQILEMVAYNAPQVVASTGLSLAIQAVTKNPVLATSFGLSSSYGLGASEVYNQARSNGLSDKQALPLAQVGGAIIGLLDFIPLERLISKTGATDTIKKTVIRKIGEGIVSVGKQAGFEGITESAQEIIGNAIESTYKENKDLFEGAVDAGLVGAILGGGSDLTLSGIMGLTNKGGDENVYNDLDKKVSEAIETAPQNRTEEQKQIVEAIYTEVVTPDEALTKVADTELENTDIGKEIVKTALDAKQQDKNVSIRLSEDQKSVEIETVEKNSTQDIEKIIENKAKRKEAGEAMGGKKESDPLSALKEEARKYKSAEEFKKALGNRLQYRGGRDLGNERVIDLQKQNMGGLFFTENPEYAQQYARDRQGAGPLGSGGAVYQSVLPENLKLFDINNKKDVSKLIKNLPKKLVESGDYDNIGDAKQDVMRWVGDMKKTNEHGFPDWATISQYSDEIEKAGFDGFRAAERPGKIDMQPDGSYKITGKPVYSTALFKGGVPAVKNIEDFYTQATKEVETKTDGQKEVSVPKGSLPIGEGKKKVSTLEARMRNVLDGVTEEQIEELGLSTYRQMNKAETIAKAAEYVSNNRSEAIDVLQGKKDAPDGILPEAIYVALTQEAKGDITLATKLASLQATALGQRISLLAEIDPDSPVKILNEIYRLKEEVFKEKFKGRKIKDTTKNVKESIKKESKVANKYDWDNFISSLEC